MSSTTSSAHGAQGTPRAAGSIVDDGVEDVPSFEATGGDWSEIAEEAARLGEERIVVNMGPQHPSTHGVLRLMLEIDGETVTEARCGIGYLHTGIEKNMEYRTWSQGPTFCTRMDYLASFFQETAFCLGVERLLGIADDVPERATVIRVLMMELNRISSHLVCLATGGNELGATTIMTTGFTAREEILKIFELVTGLRMNHAYVRPGGVVQDIPPGALDTIREALGTMRGYIRELEDLMLGNPIYKGRTVGVGHLSLAGCMALGITGPVLRSAGLPYDLRKADPYCGYETYDFDVPTSTDADSFSRTVLRIEECYQSMRIVEQALDRLQAIGPGPVMVADKKIAWPAQLAIGSDGMGNSLDHIRTIMGTSMEALIHHFKIVTEGFRVPAGQVFQAVEHPRGVLGAHLVSDGGTRPYRAHFRDPSFNNLQGVSLMCEGGQVADVVVAVAALDPVLGGVDR
ncbi:NADH-quinone oxidoreductase subunit D [Cellulomonas carbonis]|uniref:NADH-quinone oxidoreductase subunit D n=1 Tax=Cellulomonas carbonis T26 TaxID=947969 RepID=A0A0A0BSJ3_9CELL|nr:NADH-quinone oxidoreductase subunit D [Cellulomonas carbonis]KGM11413.1 NADH dehydrogenase [Cellulomonas carbonis T26]MDT0165422.1 NADH-quinone oxidoreductase subunit D [Actinotalea sp. AC32]GGC09374.1 NADH-quinone oxidoreductase subunit D 2 [Cellulomonas carbonis]